MKKKLLYVCGYVLLGLAGLVGAVANIVTLTRGGASGAALTQTIMFTVALFVIFGICAHLSVVWILRILKDREISKENK